jgi:prepilin-type N-terminal cleavage/methylation domain-containing protein
MAQKELTQQGGFTLVEIMIVLGIIGLVLAIAIPALSKNRRDAQGSACNGQIDAIYSAKEQLAFKLNLYPGGPLVPVDADQLNGYLRGTDVSDQCPGGGAYNLGATLNDVNGGIIVPTCDMSGADAGGGVTFQEEGLHIHRRSFVQDANGNYTQIVGITFAS